MSAVTAERTRNIGLDAVRALAIGLVLVQHVGGPMRLPLGGTGVSLFFGLSGYLITGLLLSDLSTRGLVAYGAFYRRRFLRLAPALVVMVTTCTAFLGAVGRPVPWRDALTAVTYTKNYAEIVTDRGDGLLGHTWSLAVEEHFYLLWPLALVALLKICGPRRVALAVVTICAVALGVRATLLLTVHPGETYFYEDSLMRMDALLLGCAARLAVQQGWRPGGRVLAAGVGVLVALVVWPSALYTSLLMSSVAGVGSALLVAGAAGLTEGRERLPGSGAARTVADLSYGLYLWHFPLITICVTAAGHSSLPVRLVAFALATLLAYGSRRFVELPLLDRFGRSRASSRSSRRSSRAASFIDARTH